MKPVEVNKTIIFIVDNILEKARKNETGTFIDERRWLSTFGFAYVKLNLYEYHTAYSLVIK